MSASTTTLPRPVVSEEVLAFARDQGVEEYVPKLVDLAQRVYPSATRFDLFVEDDPEIPDDRHIVFELDVPLDLEQARMARDRWYAGKMQMVPGPVICVFRLSAYLKP